ncbi:hypothetical protein JXA85_02570 [Candidatus Woesearchaeota archaeon]|nr:hypothetical protein [Candidatus Woesearchaeota archaeon]
MGLFGLKKKPKTEIGSADLPPPVPPGEELDGDIPAPPSDFDLNMPLPPGSVDQNNDSFPEPPEINEDQPFEMPSFPEPPQENMDFSLPPMGDDSTFSQGNMPPRKEEPIASPKQEPVPTSPQPAIKQSSVQPNRQEPVQAKQPPEQTPQQTVQPQEEPKPVEQKRIDFSNPLFVPIEEYKETEKNVNNVNADVKRAEDNLERLSSIESEGSVVMERITKNADFVLKKLSIIDKKLFKKG